MENFIEETSSLKQSEKNRKKYFIYTLVSYASLAVAILSLFFAPIFIKVKDDKITIVASGAYRKYSDDCSYVRAFLVSALFVFEEEK